MPDTINLSDKLVLVVARHQPNQQGLAPQSALARQCGAEAMKSLQPPVGSLSGPPASSIGRGPLGEPLFPPPFKGSLAHAPGWACALGTNNEALLSVGVDIEPLDRPFRPAIANRIASETEKRAFAAWQNDATLPPYWRSGLALFCAKEAVLKALSPLVQRRLLLSELSLTVTPAMAHFELSPGAIFAHLIHGYIITWQGALVAYAVASTPTSFAPLSMTL